MSSPTEVRDQAIEVARGWSAADAPSSWRLTAALFEAIADDAALLEAVASLPADRLPALLAGAAITLLARRDPSAAVHAYFPMPGRSQPPFDDGFFPAFAVFCSSRLDHIVALCHQHQYQMNEVARCSQLACGLAAVHGPSEEPVTLIDLGAGAGLALALDRYHYQLGQAVLGPPESPLTLSCTLRGNRQPPLSRLPPIAERIGIDLDPLNVDHEGARDWLEACAPPEEAALQRLASALEVVRADPPTILAGDAVEVLPEVLDRLPVGRSVVVVDSYTAVFLSEDRRLRLAEVLGQAGRSRSLLWLSLDPLVPLGPSGRHSVQGLAVPDDLVADYQREGVFAVLGARRFSRRSDQGQLLARSHPSGDWIEWLDGPPQGG